MINLKALLFEAELDVLNDKLGAAVKAGPAATRAFLNSKEGQTASLNKLLKSPQDDGDDNDDKVKIQGPVDISVDPSNIVPTQNFIDLMKSVAYPLGTEDYLTKTIETGKVPGAGTIVASQNAVIDGHHRWSSTVAINPNGKINALNVEWPGQNVQEKLAAAQLAIAGSMDSPKKQPSASGNPDTDILGKSSKDVSKLIMANINKKGKNAPGGLLNDGMMKILVDSSRQENKVVMDWLGDYGDRIEKSNDKVKAMRLAIAAKVGDNLAKMQKPENDIDRPDMPQFDPKVGGPKLKAGSDLVDKLSGGELNISRPYTKESVFEQMQHIYKKETTK